MISRYYGYGSAIQEGNFFVRSAEFPARGSRRAACQGWHDHQIQVPYLSSLRVLIFSCFRDSYVERIRVGLNSGFMARDASAPDLIDKKVAF